jgi:hypothetical protein
MMQACAKMEIRVKTRDLITWLSRIPVTNSSFPPAVLFENYSEDPRLDNLATSNSSYQL